MGRELCFVKYIIAITFHQIWVLWKTTLSGLYFRRFDSCGGCAMWAIISAVIPCAMRHAVTLCRHGIALGKLGPAASDPGPAQRCFTPQRIRDDGENSIRRRRLICAPPAPLGAASPLRHNGRRRSAPTCLRLRACRGICAPACRPTFLRQG
jgi:hypothetical protein